MSDGKQHLQQAKIVPLAPAAGLADRSDDELMELAAADVRVAMGELVDRYGRRVRSYCCRWDPDRGEDLAQDVFLQLWKTRRRYRPGGRFELYLFTIVRNRCRNARRDWFRRGQRERLSDTGAPSDNIAHAAGSNQLDALLEFERQRRVDHEISRLPAKLREAMLLRFAEGLPYADVARIVSSPEATVRSRVHLALKRLQQRLISCFDDRTQESHRC